MPVLRHATLAKLLPSIRKHGLLTAKAVGAKRVWLHSPTKSFWGALHTVKRHGG